LGLLWKVVHLGYFTSGLLKRIYDSKFLHPLAIHMYFTFSFVKKKKKKKKRKEKKKERKKKKKNSCDKVIGKWCCF